MLTEPVYTSYLIRLFLNFEAQQGSKDIFKIPVKEYLRKTFRSEGNSFHKEFKGISSLENPYTEYHENNLIILVCCFTDSRIYLETAVDRYVFEQKIIEYSVSLINEVLKVKSTNTKSYRHMLETLLMVSKAKLEEDVSKPIIDEMQRLISGIDPNIDEIFSESTSNKDKFQKICHKIAYRRL